MSKSVVDFDYGSISYDPSKEPSQGPMPTRFGCWSQSVVKPNGSTVTILAESLQELSLIVMGYELAVSHAKELEV